jgi:hypothetical protein
MSNGFNGIGKIAIASGASVRLGVVFPNGEDRGAQAIMANPINPIGRSALEVSNLTKVKFTVANANIFRTEYWVTVKNVGGSDDVFDLSGGGY